MKRSATIVAVGAALSLALAPTTQGVGVEHATSLVPGHAAETNPVGSLNWLPPNANEDGPGGFGNHRMIVTYDHSLAEDGTPTDLIAAGTFGMKVSATTTVNPETLEPLPLRMTGHSEHVSSLDDQGAPAELDAAFMGVAGDVRDGDCALLHDDDGPEGFSAAYTTTRTVLDPAYTAGPCETIDETLTEDGAITGYVVTEHVPGFWIDVNWPQEHNGVDGTPGWHFAEVWYGAVVDTDGDGDGEWYAEADTPGNSTSIGGPLHVDHAVTMTAIPGGWNAPDCYDWPMPSPPESFDEQAVDLSGFEGERITIALWNKGDWDLFVESPSGRASNGGGGFIVQESTGQMAFEPGVWTLRGCNFAGEHEVLLTISID